MAFQPGDISSLDSDPCVVVGLSGQILGEAEVPEEHIAVWFAINNAENQDTGHGRAKDRIEVRTAPEEYFKLGPAPIVSH